MLFVLVITNYQRLQACTDIDKVTTLALKHNLSCRSWFRLLSNPPAPVYLCWRGQIVVSSLYQFVVCRWNDIHPAIQRSDQINLELVKIVFHLPGLGWWLRLTMLSSHLSRQSPCQPITYHADAFYSFQFVGNRYINILYISDPPPSSQSSTLVIILSRLIWRFCGSRHGKCPLF